MAKTTEIVVTEEAPKQSTNLFSFFPKLKPQFPFLKPNQTTRVEASSGGQEPKPNVVVGVGAGDQSQGNVGDKGLKSNVVRFPKRQVVLVPPPLETRARDSTTSTSTPIIPWQVYAFGGIIVLGWIWARWNERKAGGNFPNDERAKGRHSDDGQSSDSE